MATPPPAAGWQPAPANLPQSPGDAAAAAAGAGPKPTNYMGFRIGLGGTNGIQENPVFDPSANGGKGAWTLGGAVVTTDANGNVTSKTGADGKVEDITKEYDYASGKTLGPGGDGPLKSLVSQVPGYSTAAAAVDKVKNYATQAFDPSTPANPADSIDAQNARALGAAYSAKALGATPGTAPTVAATQVAPTTQDQTQSDQARATAAANLQQLQGVANGTTRTAADALLTQGTDAAAARARGLAAAYSRSNPGAALRAGLAAGNTAQNAATAQADQLKAQEQATAQNQIGTLADAVRTQDAQIANANQMSADAAQKENQAATLSANQGNQTANIQQKTVDNNAIQTLGTLGNDATKAPLAAQIANQDSAVKTEDQKQKGFGAATNFVSGLISSDKRAKKDIAPRALADAYADKIHGASYSYKPGEGDGGKHVGVMAQEIQKAVPGVVKPDARGMKTVDTGHLTLANTALLGELARRLREIDGGKKTKGRA